MRIFAFAGLFGAVFAGLGCGGREQPPEEKPSKEEVRAAYALNGGSCWLYKYSLGGADQLLSISVSEPNDRVIANEVVYVVSFYRVTGGGLPDKWYLDAESDAEIRLLRSDVGRSEAEQVVSQYKGEAPLFARFVYDDTKQAILEQGARFESTTTPVDKDGNDKAPEQHRWTVLPKTMVPTTEGDAEAYELQYEKTVGDMNPQIAAYHLVPGYGFAKFEDFDGNIYHVCDARVCDGSGACTGADDCLNLQCPR